MISYILLCGYPPFYDENDANLFAQILKGELVIFFVPMNSLSLLLTGSERSPVYIYGGASKTMKPSYKETMKEPG